MEKAVLEAVWFLDYYINLAEEKFANDPVAQKHYLSEDVVPFFGFIADALEQDHYIKELVNKFEISEKVIRELIKNKGIKAGIQKAVVAAAEVGLKPAALEKEILVFYQMLYY